MPGARLAQYWSFRPLGHFLGRAPLVAWTAIGFAAMAGALHMALPASFQLYAEPRSEKLAMLDARRASVNAAAFGSSRVHNGFDPRTFDEALRAHGYPVFSLNLGIFGGSQTEQRALARDFVGHLVAPSSPPRICIVLLELNAGLNFQAVNLFHPRSINLYDPDTTFFAMRFTGDRLGSARRVGRAATALAAGLLHLANVGMLGEALFEPVPEARGASETRDILRGFLNEDPTPAGLAGVRQAFASRPAESASEVEPVLPGNREMLADLSATSAVSNVQFAYFVTPSLGNLRLAPLYPEQIDGPGGPVPIFNLARPEKYPALFDEKQWHDPGHLSRLGAAMFSRLLAEEVRVWISKTPRASRCGE